MRNDKFQVVMDKSLRDDFKILCIKKKTTMMDVTTKLVKKWIEENK